MSPCDTEPRLDMRDGETVKYTAQYFASARFVAVSPKLTRNSNCYMRHRTPRIYVDTRWREIKKRGEKEAREEKNTHACTFRLDVGIKLSASRLVYPEVMLLAR